MFTWHRRVRREEQQLPAAVRPAPTVLVRGQAWRKDVAIDARGKQAAQAAVNVPRARANLGAVVERLPQQQLQHPRLVMQ